MNTYVCMYIFLYVCIYVYIQSHLHDAVHGLYLCVACCLMCVVCGFEFRLYGLCCFGFVSQLRVQCGEDP